MATTRIGFWSWIWSGRHCGVGQEVACYFNTGKTWLVSFDDSNNSNNSNSNNFISEKSLSECKYKIYTKFKITMTNIMYQNKESNTYIVEGQ